MPLLIDGYNLLHVAGVWGGGRGPGGLERSRLALLNFLAESIEPKELSRTTVVFDAHNAPSGVPRRLVHRGIAVCFAAQHEEADDLIEELIRADSAPRRLTVVSSDHRIQRAARRRRANAIDSDVWCDQLVHQREERRMAGANPPVRPPVPLLEEDVNYWLRQFGGAAALAEWFANEKETQGPSADNPRRGESSEPFENPFPPGYGEDLLRDI